MTGEYRDPGLEQRSEDALVPIDVEKVVDFVGDPTATRVEEMNYVTQPGELPGMVDVLKIDSPRTDGSGTYGERVAQAQLDERGNVHTTIAQQLALEADAYPKRFARVTKALVRTVVREADPQADLTFEVDFESDVKPSTARDALIELNVVEQSFEKSGLSHIEFRPADSSRDLAAAA